MADSLVVVRQLTIPMNGLSTAPAGLRIAHVSDLHFRRWNRVVQAAQKQLLTLDYDLLLITGDFGTVPRHQAHVKTLIRRFFEPIAQRVPLYAVLGNHDDPDMAGDPDLPLTFLQNESVVVECAGTSLELAGVDQTTPEAEDLEAALPTGQDRLLTILLAHYPSTVFRLPPARVNLQLSGHTHGGQIRIPYVGCLWTNDRIARRMARGLHAVAGTFLHINPGIGVSLPIPLRIFCPPEVAILTLQSAPLQPMVTMAEEKRAATAGRSRESDH